VRPPFAGLGKGSMAALLRLRGGYVSAYTVA